MLENTIPATLAQLAHNQAEAANIDIKIIQCIIRWKAKNMVLGVGNASDLCHHCGCNRNKVKCRK